MVSKPNKKWRWPSTRPQQEKERDFANGVAYIDPARSGTGYVSSYVRAVGAMAERMAESSELLDGMALPQLYLIRHSLELMLKSLLANVLDIADHRRLLQVDPGFAPTPKDLHDVSTSHDLKRLRALLLDAATALELGEPTATLARLVEGVSKAEGDVETTFRYRTHWKQRLRKEVNAIEEPTRFRVMEFSQLLEQAYRENFIRNPASPEGDTFETCLWAEQQHLAELDYSIQREQAQRQAEMADTLIEFDEWLRLEIESNADGSNCLAGCHGKLIQIARKHGLIGDEDV